MRCHSDLGLVSPHWWETLIQRWLSGELYVPDCPPPHTHTHTHTNTPCVYTLQYLPRQPLRQTEFLICLSSDREHLIFHSLLAGSQWDDVKECKSWTQFLIVWYLNQVVRWVFQQTACRGKRCCSWSHAVLSFLLLYLSCNMESHFFAKSSAAKKKLHHRHYQYIAYASAAPQ